MIFFIFLFAFFLSVVHFFADRLSNRIERFHSKIISFSAGIFITYIFLTLFPEFLEGTSIIGSSAFIFLLLGFVIFHSLEKYLYQHIENKDALLKDLAELHAIGFFFDHFVIGIILFFALKTDNLLVGGLIFLPLLLHTISSSLSLKHIYKHFKKNLTVNILLSTSPIFGVLFVSLMNPGLVIYYSIFSFVLGTLLYVVIRDTIPKGAAGNIGFFLIGVTLASIIISITSQI